MGIWLGCLLGASLGRCSRHVQLGQDPGKTQDQVERWGGGGVEGRTRGGRLTRGYVVLHTDQVGVGPAVHVGVLSADVCDFRLRTSPSRRTRKIIGFGRRPA